MFTAGLIKLSAALLCIIGLTNASDVTQTDKLWKNESDSATIHCSHTKDASYFQMYWYRQLPGERMKEIVYTTTTPPYKYANGFSEDKFPATRNNAQTGSLTVEKLVPEDSGVYFCAVSQQGDNNPAYFGQGTKLTVLEKNHTVTPPTVKVFKPHLKECMSVRQTSKDGQKKTLVCVASGFYPDHVHVSWKNGDNITTIGVATDSNAVRDGNYYKISSRLRVSADDWHTPGRKFTCIVTFFDGTNDKTFTAFVSGEANNDQKTVPTEQLSRIFQTAKLSYGVFIIKSSIYGVFVTFLVWKLQGSAGKQN